MRLQLTDYNGRPWIIDSQDPTTLGRWFGEHVGALATNVPALLNQCRVMVVPETSQEMKHWQDAQTAFSLDSKGLIEFYLIVRALATKALESEINGQV